MAQTPITEGRRDDDFIVSEANGYRSREEVTIEAAAMAAVLEPGTVLAKRTSTGNYARFAVAGADGTGTAVAIVRERHAISAAVDVGTIIARDAEVKEHMLVWPAGITGPQIAAAIVQLNAVGIIARQKA